MKIQKKYHPLDTTEWGWSIKALISDIIHNRRRNIFRKEKERCGPDSTRKRGRPAKPLSQQKRLKALREAAMQGIMDD